MKNNSNSSAHTGWLGRLQTKWEVESMEQCPLLPDGALFEQFRFFWSKERKMILALRRVVVKA